MKPSKLTDERGLEILADDIGFKYTNKYKNPCFIGYVYELTCITFECVYVGKALNMRPVSSPMDYTRISQHFCQLKSGSHPIKKMQFDWIMSDGDVSLSIIEEFDVLKDFEKLSEFNAFLHLRERQEIRHRFDAGIELYNKLIPVSDLSRYRTKTNLLLQK